MTKRLDIIGDRFNRLVVVSLESVKADATFWRCRCDCGKEIVVKGTNLRSGNTNSCGCYMKDQTSKTSIKLWQPIANKGSYLIPLTKSKNAIIDKEDLEKIKDFKWVTRGPEGYAISRCKNSGKIVRMHRIILGVTNPKMDVDHINHDTLDNRKQNLRVCEHHKNCANKRPDRNSTGITGVSKRKGLNKYNAYITVKKKNIHLGYFYDIADAINARKNAELRYFREYRYNGT